jgi:hypothetical protein
MTLNSKFDIGDRVVIDDNDITGFITAIRWSRDNQPAYEVSWFNSGSAEFVYFDEWRLTNA